MFLIVNLRSNMIQQVLRRHDYAVNSHLMIVLGLKFFCNFDSKTEFSALVHSDLIALKHPINFVFKPNNPTINI